MKINAVIHAVSLRIILIPHIPTRLKSTSSKYRTPLAFPRTLMKYGLDVKTAKPVSPTIENNPPNNFRNLVSTVDSRNSNKRIPVLEQLITSKDNIEKVKTL